jgi:hypothetical protein
MNEGRPAGKRRMIVVLALVAFSMSNPAKLDAVPSPEQHEMSGMVQRVDRETITIVLAGESKPAVFGWSKDTKFVRNSVFTTPDSLHPGTQVRTRCSHPIFGRPLLYRVAWQTKIENSSTTSAAERGKHHP